uniref:Uncharacterized protein n=1 Tax=Peronospora matthiolae TaxID=2874970 RepID=A0AAV1V8P5_9STRA
MDVTANKAPRWFEKSRQRQVREVPDSISGKAQPSPIMREEVREVPDSISGKAQPVTDHAGKKDWDKFEPKLLLVREVPDSISGKAQPLVQSLEHEDVKSGERSLVV